MIRRLRMLFTKGKAVHQQLEPAEVVVVRAHVVNDAVDGVGDSLEEAAVERSHGLIRVVDAEALRIFGRCR